MAGQQGPFSGEPGESDLQQPQRSRGIPGYRKACGRLRPYHVTRDQAALGAATANRLPRPLAESRVGTENVDEDTRVEGGYQMPSASPRTPVMNSSVPSPSSRIP